MFKREPVAYALGEDQFKLFELVPKMGVNLNTGDRVYIGKDLDLRQEVLHVKNGSATANSRTPPRASFHSSSCRS